MVINYKAHGSVLELLYEDRLSVTVRGSVEVDETGETVVRDKLILEDIPCRLSKAQADTKDQGMSFDLTSRADLYTGAGVDIPYGSKVTIAHAGKDIEYDQCILDMCYSSHNKYKLLDGQVVI